MPSRTATDFSPSADIIVVGAGIGGLVAALALVQRGVSVRVVEQAGELKEIGAGIQLSANATRVLYQLGLGDQLSAIEAQPEGKEVRLWSTGQRWRLFDLGVESIAKYGYPYVTLYRADLHKLLAEALQQRSPGCLQLGARCVASRQFHDHVEVTLENGSRITGALLIGADGVHSMVRQQHIALDNPVFSGFVAWRGVIPSENLPERLRAPIGVNWVGPGAHVIHYPLRRGELINFVGIVERDDWQVESWTERGSTDECLHDFAGWNEDVLELAAAVPEPYKWALMVREPISNWTDARVTLLGDAAHPTLPFLAQGAAMAIEDGYILARCLDAFSAAPEAALKRYQDLRIDRTSKIVRGSAENARRFHDPRLADADGASEYVSQQWDEARVRERYQWLFEYDVDAVLV